MARGGITKTAVKKAIEAILAQGKKPSLDTIRIELGNTGSKSTIHRYLKELEEEEGSQLGDEALLSNTIKEMAARMASRLREEAGQAIQAAAEKHQADKKTWKMLEDEHSKALQHANERIDQLLKDLSKSEKNNTALNKDLQSKSDQATVLKQQVKDFKALIDEKDRHIESLEEKHLHSRESLEHYRASVKEQRDQDSRRHEQQVQQLQAEQRHLNQTISLKQTDILVLNKDNGRLVSEMGELRKQLAKSDDDLKSLDARYQAVEEKHIKAIMRLENNEDEMAIHVTIIEGAQEDLKEANDDIHDLEVEMAGLKSEINIKDKILTNMTFVKNEESANKS